MGAAIARATGTGYGLAAVGLDVASGCVGVGLLAKAAKLDKVLDAARAAGRAVGAGRGAVHGTRVHTAMKTALHGADDALSTEVSYLNGAIVKPGTKGSIRVDVVEGAVDNPGVIYDLKTGAAQWSLRRIEEIRRHLPFGGRGVTFVEVK